MPEPWQDDEPELVAHVLVGLIPDEYGPHCVWYHDDDGELRRDRARFCRILYIPDA